MIYLFTGQPHSGKTTLANTLKEVLLSNNPEKQCFVLDGDYLREIFENVDYSETGRTYNIKTAHSIAIYLDSLGLDVIISMVSPFRDLRDSLKNNYGAIEIYTHTTEIRGREKFHIATYEEPLENFIDIDTTNVSVLESVNELLDKIYANGRE